MMKFSIIIIPFEENAKFAEYFLDLFTFFLLESLIKYVHTYAYVLFCLPSVSQHQISAF